MRVLLALSLAALAMTALAGCAGDSGDQTTDLPPAAGTTLQGQQFEGDPSEGEQAAPAPAQGHGQFQREDSAVETGLDPTNVPGAYARKTITITNDFGGADRASVAVSVGAGSIRVLPGAADGYRIEALLEARGLTELDAADQLSRLDLVHTDALRADGLHLSTETQREPEAEPIPGVSINLGANVWSDVVVYLPASPSYTLSADSGSGDIGIKDLRGRSFTASTGSGDVLVQGLNAGELSLGTGSGDLVLDSLEAARGTLDTGSGKIAAKGVHFGKLVADTASGDIDLAGIVDSLEADSGSGSIRIDAHGQQSGSYAISTSSGDVVVDLLYAGGRAYRVTAETASGDVSVDLPNSRTTSDSDDDSSVAKENRDFADARIRTVVAVDTGSGDITVKA